MNNSLNVAKIGFCKCAGSTIYVSNNDIRGFKIEPEYNADRYVLKLYSSFGFQDIYIAGRRDTNFNDFKIISNKIIKKILDSLRYDISVNLDVDKIIDEVTNNEK